MKFDTPRIAVRRELELACPHPCPLPRRGRTLRRRWGIECCGCSPRLSVFRFGGTRQPRSQPSGRMFLPLLGERVGVGNRTLESWPTPLWTRRRKTPEGPQGLSRSPFQTSACRKSPTAWLLGFAEVRCSSGNQSSQRPEPRHGIELTFRHQRLRCGFSSMSGRLIVVDSPIISRTTAWYFDSDNSTQERPSLVWGRLPEFGRHERAREQNVSSRYRGRPAPVRSGPIVPPVPYSL